MLVSGGFAPAPLSSSELFSLRTLTWSPGPPLPHPRAGGASVPRPADGSMLVVGGSLEREESARRVLRYTHHMYISQVSLDTVAIGYINAFY